MMKTQEQLVLLAERVPVYLRDEHGERLFAGHMLDLDGTTWHHTVMHLVQRVHVGAARDLADAPALRGDRGALDAQIGIYRYGRYTIGPRWQWMEDVSPRSMLGIMLARVQYLDALIESKYRLGHTVTSRDVVRLRGNAQETLREAEDYAARHDLPLSVDRLNEILTGQLRLL